MFIPNQVTPPFAAWLRRRGDCDSLAELQATASASGIRLEPVLIQALPAFFRVTLANGQTHELSSIHAARGLISREVERQAIQGADS